MNYSFVGGVNIVSCNHVALLKYCKKDYSIFPNPQGPLSSQLLSSNIAAANESVTELILLQSKHDSWRTKCATY